MPGSHTSRIEVYENGRLVPAVPQSPVVSISSLLGDDVILETHKVSHAAVYRERELTSHVLFLYDAEPVRAKCRVDSQRYDIQVVPGHLWLLPRSSRHSSQFYGPHGGILLSIGELRLKSHIDSLPQSGRIELEPKINLIDGQLEHLMRGLSAVAHDNSQSDVLVGDLLINAICIRLAKHYALPAKSSAPLRGGLPASRLKKVLEFIDTNLDRSIRLPALAEAANMSLYYFATLFRQSTGLSPHRYILKRRVERAKDLLLHTDLSILEVGLNLGFEHQNNFARTFRRITGFSPRHFRNERP